MVPLRLLLVDDDPEIGYLIRRSLSREAPHFSVEFVEGGKACLDYLDKNGVDCIISDYQMPGMDGMELLKILRERGNNVPFIFVTGQGSEQVAAEAFKEGADDYFTKEIGFAHFKRIMNSVEQAVRRRKAEAERELALNSLIESERRFRKLIEYAADAFFLHDRQGRFLDVNRTACATLGYSREELLKMNVQDVEQGVGHEELDDLWALCAAGQTVDLEGVHRRKDGTTFPVEVRIGTLEVEGERLFLALARDITRRREAERRAENLRRIYVVLSNTNQLILRVRDRETLFREACRISVEDGGFVMSWIGLVDEQSGVVVPKAFAGREEGYLKNVRISAKDVPEGHGPTGNAIRSGWHFICNDIENDKDMKPWCGDALERGYRSSAAFPLKVDKEVVGAYMVYSGTPGYFDMEEVALLDELAGDISYCLGYLEHEERRRHAEEALRESEANFRNLVENSLVGVYVIQDGRLVYVNSRFAEIFGYTAEELLTSVKLEETIAPGSRALVKENMRKRLSGEETSSHYRFRALKSDNTEFDVEVYGSLTEYKGRPAVIGSLLEVK